MTDNNTEKQKSAVSGTLWIVFLFISLQFGVKFVLDIGINITPTDIAILLSLFFLPIIKHFRFRINSSSVILFTLIFIGFMLEIISALVRGYPENITLGIALLRNAALIFLIQQINYDYKKLSKGIVISGVFFSIIAIAGYIKAFPHYPEIIVNEDLWKPDLFYMLDGAVLRLTGLAGDPNYFFLINLLPLLLSISLIREKKKKFFSVPIFIIILTASLLTFSRTGMLLLGLLLLITIFKKGTFKKIFLILIVLSSIIIASIYISETYNVLTPYDVIVHRFEAVQTGVNPRISLWETAIDGFLDSPVFGKGGRYVMRESMTEKYYAHNDYLDMLASHGLTGFGLMMLLYLYILLFIKNKYKSLRDNYLFTASCQLFVFALVAALFHTIYYVPFIWLSIAFIFSFRED